LCSAATDSIAIMDAQAQRKAKIFSRREIEGQIANGRAIVIVGNKVLNVGSWMPYHPGGDKAMRHMIGRDATDEVTRYAGVSSSPLLLLICVL
jgi:delta8-fatty-acid desaturase